MVIDLGSICVGVVLLFIDFYSETQIKNYGSIIERLVYLINIKSLFNILKLIFLLYALLLFFGAPPLDYINKSLDVPLRDLYLNGILIAGFISIFNGIYNLLNIGFSEWVNKENVLGVLPIRISSILILFYLMSYIYKEVLNKSFFSFLIIAILPVRNDVENNVQTVVNLNNSETLFFCQISFYVVNLALAEMFIIYGHQSIYLSILNFSILFIIDDFKLIDDYRRRFGSILKSHFLRLTIFNLIMISISITVLITYNFYWHLTIYFLLLIILGFYYFKNLHYYRLSYH